MVDNEVHTFGSGKADGGDATLVRPSNWNAPHKRGQKMLNNSGSTRSANDVVQLDASSDDSFKGSSVAGAFSMPWVVTDTTINTGAQGNALAQGDATIKVQGAVTRGNYLRLSATAQAAEDTGVAVGAMPPPGTVAVAKTGFAGPGAGTVLGYLFGGPVFYDGAYSVRGLIGAPNAGAPGSKYDMTADMVAFRIPTGGAYVVKNVSTVTQDTGQDNTVANGRDQAGAFSANSWIHFYLVLAITGVGVPVVRSRSSVTAPPTGPTLASGEIAWAYVGAIRYDGTPALVKTRINGSHAMFETRQVVEQTLSQVTEKSVDLSTFAPPNAVRLVLSVWVRQVGNASNTVMVRIVSGSNYAAWALTTALSTDYNSWATIHEFPNINRTIFYLFDLTGADFVLDAMGYVVPNGGE